MPTLTRFLRWWHRRPGATHWAAVAAVAAVAVLLIAASQRKATEAAQAWGEPVMVLQAQRPLAAGSSPAQLGSLDVAPTQVPTHLVPDQALFDLTPLAEQNPRPELVRAIPAGSLLSAADFGQLSVVAPGRRAVTISVQSGSVRAPNVAIGTRVDLLLFGEVDPFAPAKALPPQKIEAVVIQVLTDAWTVEVAAQDADTLAAATVSGVIVPILRG